MSIKTLGDFRNATKDLPDDFRFDVKITTDILEEELKGMLYQYPWRMYNASIEISDIGYSGRSIFIRVYEDDGE